MIENLTAIMVAVRELGLLALLVLFAIWMARTMPGAIVTWATNREKDRQTHREIQDRMDDRANKLIEAISKMCRYHPQGKE